ncbi:MAG: hypothetical protein Q9208_006790 [Pyrenodesmia sp. 3 TL-2023]
MNWYDSLQAAFAEAESTILEIVQLIDKVKATNMAIQTFLSILTIGLSMVITIPDFAKIDDGAFRVASILNEVIRQYPTIGRVLFPAGGTLESQQFQVAQLSSMLRKQEIRISNTLEDGLTLVMNNSLAFKAFTSSGAFAVDFGEFPSLNAIKKQLLLALQTYLVSVALAGNGWDVALIPGTDPRGITNGSTPVPEWALTSCSLCPGWTDLKCPDYDANGQCNRWWYSVGQNATYTLGNGKLEDPSEILSTIFAKGWTTGQLLFENAAACSITNWLNANKLQPIEVRIEGPKIITNPPHELKTSINIDDNPVLSAIVALSPKPFAKDFDLGGPLEWANLTTMLIQLQHGSGELKLQASITAGDGLFIPWNSTLNQLNHPQDTFYNITSIGMDFSCISQ